MSISSTWVVTRVEDTSHDGMCLFYVFMERDLKETLSFFNNLRMGGRKDENQRSVERSTKERME